MTAVNAAAKTPISEREVAAVGPFELRPKPEGKDCKGNADAKYDRGVLLIHGLNDTPFSMWDLGFRFAQACYLVRAILLPGHGTVPGDLLRIGPSAWRDAVAKAVWGFRGEVDRLVIAGFDLGANLALDAALDLAMPPEVELNGVIMLAPAFDYEPPTFAPAAVAPGGNALWGEVFEKHNSFRYHSIAKPSIAATNQLGDALFAREAPTHIPLFMVLSAEDEVTSAKKGQGMVLPPGGHAKASALVQPLSRCAFARLQLHGQAPRSQGERKPGLRLGASEFLCAAALGKRG